MKRRLSFPEGRQSLYSKNWRRLVRFDPAAVSFSKHHFIRAAATEKMEKRCRPPQGFYKNLETIVVSRARMCDRKPEVLGVYDAERIIAAS